MIYTDLLFFLCILPFSVLFSFFDRSTEYKNLILVLTSLLIFSWGKPFGVCLLFLTAVAEWLIARWIEKDGARKLPILVDVIMNLFVFFLFTRKFLYLGGDAFGYEKVLGTLGILFYVTRGFAYVYDVSKGKIKAEKNVFCLITYMTAFFFMPTGPVARYGDIEPMIRKRTMTVESITKGLNSFVYGLSKAVIIAPVLRKIGVAGFNFGEINFIGCWTGALAMIGFAYFLFTGFCDMSFGLASIYGFDVKKNCRNLGVNGVYEGVIKSFGTTMFEFFEEVIADFGEEYGFFKNILVVILSALIAFMLHQSLLFLLIGIVVGVLIVLEKTMFKGFIEKAPGVLKFVLTYGISFFLFGGLAAGGVRAFAKWLGALAGIGTKYTLSVAVKYAIINNCFVVLIAALLAFTPLKEKIDAKVQAYSEKSLENYGKVSVIKTILTTLLLIVCIILVASATVKI